MSKFNSFKKHLEKTNANIYHLANEEHAHLPKFLSKLNKIFLDGSETGIFPATILDSCKNILANIDDSIYHSKISERLQDMIDYYEMQLNHFFSKSCELSPEEDKCVYAMQTTLLFFKMKRLTYGRLANLFIDINDADTIEFTSFGAIETEESQNIKEQEYHVVRKSN